MNPKKSNKNPIFNQNRTDYLELMSSIKEIKPKHEMTYNKLKQYYNVINS
jgi:hypothetical protein